MEDRILLKELADKAQPEFKDKIVLARVNGKLCELWKKVYPDSKIEYITTAQSDGLLTYKRSATLIMLKAIYDVYGHTDIERVKVEFSLSKGYYCTVKGNVSVNDEFICRVKARMREIVDGDMPIIKHTIPKDEAVRHFGNHGMYDKEKLFRYRKSSTVNVYRLDGFEDYYYGYMVPSSGYIQHYELFLYDKGFVIQFPTVENTKDIPEFAPQNKLFKVLDESTEWCRMLGVETVGDLNETIVSGNIKELILVQEALQEKKLADIAQRISDDPSKKFIMIAGPSSSGKTTTSYRLAIQLRAHGMRPHQISLDNYFVNREFTPKDENGDYNFECLEALDIEQFNKDMTALLNGERVELPSFNFKLGKREYNGDYKELGPSDVLVIEGIHGLNDRLSYSLPKESKFKIYLSALTQLNIDEHNRIPTTDGRLIRRIVRDAQTRGTSAKKTIAMWPSVRKREEENIFPFQEEADVMFNSALIYELALLKQYAEPLLFGIGRDEPEYPEANRLIKFLDYFLGIPNDFIPINSIAREFIGGSCFNV